MKYFLIQYASLLLLQVQLIVTLLPTEKQSLDNLPRDVIDRIITNHLDGATAAKFVLASNKTRKIVFDANFTFGQNAAQFTSKQYVYIKRFIQAHDYYAPMNVTHLNLIREIFNGTEKFVGGKEKMAERLKRAIPHFGTLAEYKFAIEKDDAFRVKILTDYFEFNDKSYWEELFSLDTRSQPNITRFVRNSQYLLNLTIFEEPLEKFVQSYNSLRDESSLNIVSTKQGENGFLLNKFKDLNDQDKALYDFILSQGSEFDVNAQFVQLDPNENSFRPYGLVSRLGLALKHGISENFNGAKFLLNYPNVDIDMALSPRWPSYNVLTHYSISALQFILSRKNLDINVQDELGFTALNIATINGEAEIVRFLLTIPGIDTNIKTNNGQTALMLASYNNYAEIARYLLNFPDTDANIRDDSGQTALTIAVRLKETNAARVLIQSPSVNIKIKDGRGNNAMYYAKLNELDEIIDLLTLRLKQTKPCKFMNKLLSKFQN